MLEHIADGPHQALTCRPPSSFWWMLTLSRKRGSGGCRRGSGCRVSGASVLLPMYRYPSEKSRDFDCPVGRVACLRPRPQERKSADGRKTATPLWKKVGRACVMFPTHLRPIPTHLLVPIPLVGRLQPPKKVRFVRLDLGRYPGPPGKSDHQIFRLPS